MGSLDALLALQETPSPLERRRRAIRRADGILDGLDGVKLALLGGGSPADALMKLRRAVSEARDAEFGGEAADDLGLSAVLNEVEVRAAVELAKAGLA